MHQNRSTSATKSGTTRRSRHGRKLRNSASANDAMMVLTRTGCRIWLATSIAVLGAAAAPLVLPGLGLRGARRRRGFVVEHQDKTSAVDAGSGAADHARE